MQSTIDTAVDTVLADLRDARAKGDPGRLTRLDEVAFIDRYGVSRELFTEAIARRAS